MVVPGVLDKGQRGAAFLNSVKLLVHRAGLGRVQVTVTGNSLVRSNRPLAGRHVLVVEDEYFLADEIREGLVALGAEVVGPFPDFKAAAAILRNGPPIDVALLDVNVRSEMVFPLARALRLRDVPVVFTTGYDKDVLGAEFQDVVLWQKPLNLATALPSLVDLVR
jgi:CheY-like chemotaxis protein